MGPSDFRKEPMSVTDSVGAVSVIPSSSKASYGEGERKEKNDPWTREAERGGSKSGGKPLVTIPKSPTFSVVQFGTKI